MSSTVYHMARNFLAIKSLLLSRILCKPQKFYPQNYLSLELFIETLIEIICDQSFVCHIYKVHTL